MVMTEACAQVLDECLGRGTGDGLTIDFDLNECPVTPIGDMD